MPASRECWWRSFRETGGVAIYHIDLAPDTAREAVAFSWLDQQERSRWQRFRHDGARRRFALCRSALRFLLCSQLGCRNHQLAFGAPRLGKPYAIVGGNPAPISFNVSHGSENGLIALVPGGRVGVDVQERNPARDFDGLISRVMGPSERADLAMVHGKGRLRMFYLFWTVKEALIKALGTGLTWDVSKFEVPLAMRRGMKTSIIRFPHIPEVRWRIVDLGNEQFAAAIAHEMPPDSH